MKLPEFEQLDLVRVVKSGRIMEVVEYEEDTEEYRLFCFRSGSEYFYDESELEFYATELLADQLVIINGKRFKVLKGLDTEGNYLLERQFDKKVITANYFKVHEAYITVICENNKKGSDEMKGENIILNELKSLIVEGKESGLALTPSGLSINGKVFSKKEKALLDVKGLELITDIPFGFILPTEVTDIEIGDILFDEKNEPLYVLSVNTQNKEVTCIDSDNKKSILYPVLNLFKGQVFNKLLTPFNYDLGCNPTINMITFTLGSYLNGGTQKLIKDVIPQLMHASSKLNFNKLLKETNLTFIAPLVLVGYRLVKTHNIDLMNFNFSDLSGKLHLNKKIIAIALVALLTALYLNKDKVSEFLISQKVKEIPVIGLIAKPLAKVLNKIPTIKKGIWKELLNKFNKEE